MTDETDKDLAAMKAPQSRVMFRDKCLKPQQARIFDLDLTTKGSGIEIEYSSMSVIDLSGSDWDTDLCKFIADRNRPKHPPKFVYPSTAPGRSQVELSLKAPSELRNAQGNLIKGPIKQVMYVICLHHRGKEQVERFRYTTGFDPFSYSDDDVSRSEGDRVFYNPSFIYDDEMKLGDGRDIDPATSTIKPTTRAGFIFDYDEAGIGNDFVLRFNIHCEIATKPHGRPDRVHEFLPIIIDPDVGHPGGNHGGPPSDP